eukprot:scaffold238678_cov28-Tisochrysis_lutea.AAC.3
MSSQFKEAHGRSESPHTPIDGNEAMDGATFPSKDCKFSVVRLRRQRLNRSIDGVYAVAHVLVQPIQLRPQLAHKTNAPVSRTDDPTK